MNKENQIQFPFTALKGRKIKAVFDEPRVSSDGGLVLLREALIETGIIHSASGQDANGSVNHQRAQARRKA